MNLKDYLRKNKISYKSFGEVLDTDPIYVFRIANKKNSPSLLYALLINKYTNYEVSLEELLTEKDKEILWK